MTGATYEERYAAATGALAELAGARARITYRSGAQATGVVRVKDFGHCVDVTLGSHGGQMFGDVVRVECMVGRRYTEQWKAAS